MENMIKKDHMFKWSEIENNAFNTIKQVIVEEPSLITPNFDKEFILYTFASHSSWAIVLIEKNVENVDVPIFFMSLGLHGAELKCHDIDKHAFSIYKVVKHFHPYFLKAHTKLLCPILL